MESPTPSWRAQLSLRLSSERGRCVARFSHEGPLRLLQTLYPEGDAISHHVLVHPPGGLVGGDALDIRIEAGPGTHGVLTTPGAGRFYRSNGQSALQHTRLHLAEGARLEWLPQETLCHSGCDATNRLEATLAPEAELMAWDVLALGLPASDKPFVAGQVRQHLTLGHTWLESATIAATDHRLLDGPLGLAGHRCIATLLLGTGAPLSRSRRDRALESARDVIAAHALAPTAGATSPCPEVVVVRVLAPLVEPAMDLLRQVRAAWRVALWGLAPTPPRIWSS